MSANRRRLALVYALIAAGPMVFSSLDARAATVAVGHIDGAIGPATKDYFRRALADAAEMNATCFVVEMDTPGGLASSMRDIIKDILASEIPVVVYVSPGGARAASAGAVISLASHIAAMAPGTNIGAAHPVSIGGGGGEANDTMEEKITNDAAAYARGLATQRGRNVDWAERVVRESISSTAEEALADTVIDVIAPTLDELLDTIDGREVATTAGHSVVLQTANATIVHLEPSTRERFLAWISDPNIAYLLMLLGVFAIVFEVQNPGAIFPAVIGSIALILAAFALQMLPVNFTGLALIALAVILFIVEANVASHGVLTAGGVVAMTIGSIMLIDSPLPFMKVSLKVIIPSVIATAAFFLFAVGLGIRAQRRGVVTGTSGLTGEIGTARTNIHESGSVFVHGEHWNAYSDQPISKDTKVKVVRVEGMRIKVEEA